MSDESEKWKAVQSAIGLTERAGKFLSRAVGPAVETVGGILNDQLRTWRAANLDRLERKWRRKLQERAISVEAARYLPFGDAFRVLDAASLEDDEDVQEMWAGLLAGAMDPGSEGEVLRAHIDLLKSMSGAEASLLELLYEAEKSYEAAMRPLQPGETDNSDRPSFTHLDYADAMKSWNEYINDFANRKWRQYSKDKRQTSIENLMRLRCVAMNRTPPMTFGMFERKRGDLGRSELSIRNDRGFVRLIEYLEERALDASGVGKHDVEGSHQIGLGPRANVPELKYMLTHLGRSLVEACR